MFEFFARRRRQPSASMPRHAHLKLESLEGRELPSSGAMSMVGLGQWFTHQANNNVNARPSIAGFTATGGYNRTWVFSGTVIDESPGGLTVSFGGLPSLNGRTATTGSNGSFSLTVQLRPLESGEASAQVTDGGGLTSDLVWALVDPTSIGNGRGGSNG
jgi:hypothetical protein